MRSQMPPACRAKRRRESFEASVPFAQTYLVEPLDGRHGVCLAVRLDVRRRGLRLPEQLLEHGALSIKQGQNSLLSPHLSPPFPEKPKKKKEQGSASPRSPRSSSQFFSSHQGPVQDSLPPLWCASRPSPREEGHLARLDGLQLRSALLLLVSFSSEWRRGRQGTIRGFWGIDFFLRNPRNSQAIHQFWVEKEHEKTDCKAQGEALEPGGEEDSAEDSAEDR